MVYFCGVSLRRTIYLRNVDLFIYSLFPCFSGHMVASIVAMCFIEVRKDC